MRKFCNWAIFLFILLLFFLFLLVGFQASIGAFDRFNLVVTQTIQQWNLPTGQAGNETIILFMQAVSILEFLAPLILLILIITLHLKKNYAEILFLLLSTGYLIPKIVKEIYRLGCPTSDLVYKWWVFHLPYIGPLELLKTDYCFPSGHVFSYVTFAGFLFYLTLGFVKNRFLKYIIGILLLLIIVLIGPSRIYLGAHWTMDVVGGYLLGLSYLLTTILIYSGRRTIIEKLKIKSLKLKVAVQSLPDGRQVKSFRVCGLGNSLTFNF